VKEADELRLDWTRIASAVIVMQNHQGIGAEQTGLVDPNSAITRGE
jgi:hypothetical protein